MKNHLVIGMLMLLLAGPATAMDHGNMHGDSGHGSMPGDMGMEQGSRLGDRIHQSTVDGYMLFYHLIDNEAQMAKMEHAKTMVGHDMAGMKSHHLMLYLEREGEKVPDAKVGYLVTAPDGSEQKAMAMGMTGGFGADVDLKAKGRYTIKVKAVVGEAKLVDEFSYRVE